jgi:hypothetical protein
MNSDVLCAALKLHKKLRLIFPAGHFSSWAGVKNEKATAKPFAGERVILKLQDEC